MALLTTHTDANKQVYEPTVTSNQTLGFYTSAELIAYRVDQALTTGRYTYVGMTLAAAVTCQAAVNDPNNGVFAKVVWEGGGLAYSVEVNVYLSVITKTAL